jgi:MoxR-like ATPase
MGAARARTAVAGRVPVFQTFQSRFDQLAANVGSFVRGKQEVVHLALTCLFAEGHLLIEDVPGVAKTSLAKAIAGSIEGLTVRRIQFTPDLLPADITGVQVFDQARGVFEFRNGPVFANIVVGDEINRASPRTQSALLEVMAERQITIDGDTHEVPRPFICVATQNPIEHQGTYPLPEAQLDRFLMRVRIGYPARADEAAVVADGIARRRPEQLAAVMTRAELVEMIDIASRVHVSSALRDYVVRLAAATRELPEVWLGVSPRGSIAVALAAQARAASLGRSFVCADDVKAIAGPVLSHRLLLTPEAAIEGHTAEKLIQRVLGTLPVPRIPDRR